MPFAKVRLLQLLSRRTRPNTASGRAKSQPVPPMDPLVIEKMWSKALELNLIDEKGAAAVAAAAAADRDREFNAFVEDLQSPTSLRHPIEIVASSKYDVISMDCKCSRIVDLEEEAQDRLRDGGQKRADVTADRSSADHEARSVRARSRVDSRLIGLWSFDPGASLRRLRWALIGLVAVLGLALTPWIPSHPLLAMAAPVITGLAAVIPEVARARSRRMEHLDEAYRSIVGLLLACFTRNEAHIGETTHRRRHGNEKDHGARHGKRPAARR